MFGRIALLGLATASCGLMTTGCMSRGFAAQQPGGEDRQVQLTVYKDDFAMVREKRPVSLAEGHNDLHIADVSSKLDPSSVLFTWPNPGKADVTSNTYDLGMDSGRALLKRYVGQPVDVIRYSPSTNQENKVSGTLEVASDSSIVLRNKDNFIIDPEGTVIAPARSDIVAMSQLSVGVESRSKEDTNLSVAYLTRGLGWSADYVANIDDATDTADLECWATVTNHTGTAFPKSKITLVAGSPNQAVSVVATPQFDDERAARPLPQDGSNGFALQLSAKADYNVRAESTGELYSYPIELPATVAPEEMNRVRMFVSPKVPIKKDYSVRLDPPYGIGGRPIRQNATLAINFRNDTKSGLGLPMPSGAVRGYGLDSNGDAQYIGAANIEDAPEDAPLSLTLSNVFDVTSTVHLVGVKRLDKRHLQFDYEVDLANAKKSPITLRVVQTFGGLWKIESESLPGKRLNAEENQWQVPLPASSKVKLTYRMVVGA